MGDGDREQNGRLSPEQRIQWLRLIRTENVGPATFRRLLNRFGSAEHALEALPRLSQRGGRNAPLTPPTRSQAEDEIAGHEAIGARLVAMGEADYPTLLRFISGAPPLVSLSGTGPQLDKTLGIVGARNASAAGLRMTRLLAEELGANGFTIVSGLARGIDAAAHRASLATGTVAVLAGGLDRIYPNENIPLAAEIRANGGMLISEMPLGWEPRARDFPRRNRLIAGLSRGVLVVEAARRSGSLITARLALEQNREVFAVPGSPLDPRAEGTNHLIQEGATLVARADDILAQLSVAPIAPRLFEEDDDVAAPQIVMNGYDPSDDQRNVVLASLSVTPVPIDELVQQTGIPAPAMQIILLELDLAGRLEWSAGQLVCLKS